ncbi:MAG TPA: S8 family serine peptidase [Longimicrobium sp.]|nr:S8 family serine peptidase [Longimicrobium sp.]
MKLRAKQVAAFTRSLLLLAAAAACSDLPVSPATPSAAGEPAPSFSVGGRSPRDLPAVRIDLPPAARPWDRDPAALATAVSAVGGYAVVTFKEPGSARALATGNRGAVTAGTVRAGLELLERNGVEVLELLDAIGGARVRMSGPSAAAVAASPLVDFVEPRQYASLQAQTTPWGITMVGAPAFWATNTGTGARIEIVDTGHQQNHVDLPAVPSANCAGLYGGCDDGGIWHGTHVMGIIAARNNTDGVVGVAPGITGANTYVYGACDSATNGCATDQITAGINAGIFNADVINLSVGGTAYDAGMATAVANAWSSGIVLVAAAGNNLSNTTFYPAAYTNVVGVSGVNSNKTFAGSGTTVCGGYSNYGAHVDIAAPFEAYSTIGVNTYGTLCGTSMAAPHVTGVAALLKSQNPTWTNQQIVDSLYARAEDLGTAGKDVYFGYGLVRPVRPVSAPTANISGPTSITTAGTYTWYANAAGGNGIYTYNWEYRVGTGAWSSVGTGSSYSRAVSAGNSSFELRVTVTSNGLPGSDTHLVTVNISTGGITGATVTGDDYLVRPQPGYWSVTPQGGSAPYTYQWQYKTVTGSTWTNVGTNSSTYTRNSGLQSFYVRALVTSNGTQVTSNEYYVYVENEPMCGEYAC